MRFAGVQALIFVVVTVGCTSTVPVVSPAVTPAATAGTPDATPDATAPSRDTGNLEEALSFLTPDVSTFTFDDWTAIKDSLDASDVTSASSNEERHRVLIEGFEFPPPSSGQSPPPRSELEFVMGGYGYRSALEHAESWGFDVLDYEWDATLESSLHAPIYLVRLRDDFDTSSLTDLFDERGYTTETVAGVTMYSHPLESADWLGGELAILNVAILEDGHTLMLATYPEPLRAALESMDSWPDMPEYLRATAAGLGSPFTAYMKVGSDLYCDAIQIEPPLPDELGPLNRWDAMAIGYDRELDPIGRIAFGYADTNNAAHDLAGRRLLAERGVQGQTGRPLSEAAFVVDDASLIGHVLRLDVSPVDGWPQRLMRPILDRDLIFAACED